MRVIALSLPTLSNNRKNLGQLGRYIASERIKRRYFSNFDPPGRFLYHGPMTIRGNIVDIDDRELAALQKVYSHSPRRARLAVAMVLNEMAFKQKRNDYRVISETQTVRAKRFVETSLRVQKTRPRRVDMQESEAGSIERQRFTGWIEQDQGMRDPRTHTFALAGRTGNKERGKVRGKARFKPSTKFIRPKVKGMKPYRGSSGPSQNIAAMLNVIRTKKIRRPFMVYGNDDLMASGLYMLTGKKKIKYVADISPEAQRVKRTDWNRKAAARTLRGGEHFARIWRTKFVRAMRHQYKSRK